MIFIIISVQYIKIRKISKHHHERSVIEGKNESFYFIDIFRLMLIQKVKSLLIERKRLIFTFLYFVIFRFQFSIHSSFTLLIIFQSFFLTPLLAISFASLRKSYCSPLYFNNTIFLVWTKSPACPTSVWRTWRR